MISQAVPNLVGTDIEPSALDFRPLPLLGNGHIQTVLGTLWPGRLPALAARLRFLPLADGDCLALHDSVPADWRAGDPVAVLVHGLAGCYRSGYMVRIGQKLWARGLRVVRMDLRGSGRGISMARRPYHGGCSFDVRAVLAEVGRWAPNSDIVLAGFSLGGNIVLKLAGELGNSPGKLRRVAALAPPIDFFRCVELLERPRNRLYERFFVAGLIEQVRAREHFFRIHPGMRFPRGCGIRLFDDLYTAPRNDFQGVDHYYGSAGAVALIPQISIPTLILTARDDPFIDPEPFHSLTRPECVQVRMMDRGGHLGFLGRDPSGSIRWAENRIVDWLPEDLGRQE
jgi:predicted alpha/beta-fold hydrolase